MKDIKGKLCKIEICYKPSRIETIIFVLIMISEVYNIDCMEYMKTLPDKYFDLVIANKRIAAETSQMSFF